MCTDRCLHLPTGHARALGHHSLAATREQQPQNMQHWSNAIGFIKHHRISSIIFLMVQSRRHQVGASMELLRDLRQELSEVCPCHRLDRPICCVGTGHAYLQNLVSAGLKTSQKHHNALLSHRIRCLEAQGSTCITSTCFAFSQSPCWKLPYHYVLLG
jgi:hypothetical protein